MEALETEFSKLSAGTLQSQMQEFAAASDGSLHVEQLSDDLAPGVWRPEQGRGGTFNCRNFQGVIRNDWRVTSFSSFAAHEPRTAELPDHDESPLDAHETGQKSDERTGENTIFTFPRGAGPGIFMHKVFEKLDFSAATEPSIEKLVEEKLVLYGFDKAWLPCICAMVAIVINAPLAAHDGSFTLSDLKKGSWLPELEFFFPLKFVSSEQLRRSLKGYIEDYQTVDLNTVFSTLQFKPVRGMLMGFMDMVFEHDGRYYLLDWKSNHLGYCSEEYNQDAMNREMARNLYPLQYLLYTVALNMYLSLRIKDYDYERHFGGVFYLFLRGMTVQHESKQQENQFGVFRDRPPVDLVKSLTAGLVESGGLVHHED